MYIYRRYKIQIMSWLSQNNSQTIFFKFWITVIQVRIQDQATDSVLGAGAQDVATPLIKAIKEELQKFQRPKSPNLAGISIISDPDLLQVQPEK